MYTFMGAVVNCWTIITPGGAFVFVVLLEALSIDWFGLSRVVVVSPLAVVTTGADDDWRRSAAALPEEERDDDDDDTGAIRWYEFLEL